MKCDFVLKKEKNVFFFCLLHSFFVTLCVKIQLLMNTSEIKEKVNAFLVDELEIDTNKIYDDARLKEDVGIDSLDYVDIVAFVRREYGFKIEKEQMKDVLTLGQFYEFIAQHGL